MGEGVCATELFINLDRWFGGTKMKKKKTIFVLVERWIDANTKNEKCVNKTVIKAESFSVAANTLGASINSLLVDEAIISFDYKRLARSRKWIKERTTLQGRNGQLLNAIQFTKKGSNFGGISFSVFFKEDTKEPLIIFPEKGVIYYLQKPPLF